VMSPQTQVGSAVGSLKEDFSAQSTQRRPLRTISVVGLPQSPEHSPLKRLRKRSASPVEDVFDMGYHSTPSPRPPKQPLNAFDQMRLAQERREMAAKQKLEKSEYVEAEAEESDDDDQFGFGGHRKIDDGEEEDGEDQDKTLEGLVNDAEMDDETMAEDLVMEKVKYVVHKLRILYHTKLTGLRQGTPRRG
jgi:mediator of replication checkpoint protein 1